MSAAPVRLGLVGAGRTRNGLGPFLARACEAAGARVVSVAGRDAERAQQNASELATTLGHPIAAFATLDALCESGLDAIVVASPAEHHLAALLAARMRDLPCLCEKPLVDGPHARAGIAAAEAFAARGLLLVENAIWPFVLPVLEALHGPRPAGPVRHVAMGLSPRDRGLRSMVEDSLPHLLSLVHACAPVDTADELVVARAVFEHRAPDETELRVASNFAAGTTSIEADLHLKQCPEQPRPMRFAIDGRQAERRIGAGYRLSFAGNGREVPVEDPLYSLCRAFVDGVRHRDPVAAARSAHGAATRLRLFGEVLSHLFGA